MRRSSLRFFQQPIPGLLYIPNFFSQAELPLLLTMSEGFYQRVSHLAEGQPFIPSKEHNLSAPKKFQSAHLGSGRTVAFLKKYGGVGHDMLYCKGTANIPGNIRAFVLKRILDLESIKHLQCKTTASHPVADHYNLAVNKYDPQEGSDLIERFPWHVDYPPHGPWTGVVSVNSSPHISTFYEIRRPKAVEIAAVILLEPGSLLLTSGVARWDCEHRVIQKPNQVDTPTVKTARYSMAFGGGWPTPKPNVLNELSQSDRFNPVR